MYFIQGVAEKEMMEESRASKKDYNNILDIEKTIEKDLDDLPNHNP